VFLLCVLLCGALMSCCRALHKAWHEQSRVCSHPGCARLEAEGTCTLTYLLCISRLLAAYGRSLRQGYALHISATAASQASMHLATAKVSSFRLHALVQATS